MVMKYRKVYEKHHMQRYKDKNDNKVENSINEIITPSGTYSKDEWIKLVYESMKEQNEGYIFEMLIEYVKKECAWINTDDDAISLALELYSNRVFENLKWVGFNEFNMKLKNCNKIGQLSFL